MREYYYFPVESCLKLQITVFQSYVSDVTYVKRRDPLDSRIRNHQDEAFWEDFLLSKK